MLEYVKKLPLTILAIDYTRPGSDFFQSLLDGHPQILQVTGTSLYKFDSFWRDCRKDEHDSILDQFIYNSNHFQLFDSRFNISERWNKLGVNKNEHFEVDICNFKRHFLNLISGKELSKINFFYAVHGAYWLAQGRKLEEVKMVFFHIHHLAAWDAYSEFKEPTVILMTRDIRDGWASYMEHVPIWSPHYYDPRKLLPTIRTYSSVFHHLKKFKRTYVLPIQVLHRRPEDVLKNFCRINELEYIPEVLLQSSYHGKIWWGDVMSKEKNGFNPNFGSERKWTPFFRLFDNLMVESIFFKIFNQCGHEIQTRPFSRFFCRLFFFVLVFVPTNYEVRIVKFNLTKNRRKKSKTVLLLAYMYLMRVFYYIRGFYNYVIRKDSIRLDFLF